MDLCRALPRQSLYGSSKSICFSSHRGYSLIIIGGDGANLTEYLWHFYVIKNNSNLLHVFFTSYLTVKTYLPLFIL